MKLLMGNIIAIYRKELQSYFISPLAYIIAAIFWLLNGVTFSWVLQSFITEAALRDQQAAFMQGMGPIPSWDVPYLVLTNFLGWLAIISVFLLPMLSMGLYAEERKLGTIELLATSPVTNWAVALGKLLGVVTFYVGMVLPLMIYEAMAFGASDPPFDPTVMLLGHASLVLMATAVLSIGMFLSSLTDSTILAAIMTFAVMLFLLLVNWLAETLSGPIGDILSHLSLLKHYGAAIQGTLDTSGLILFGSYIVLGIFLTAQSIQAFRFQRG